VQRDASSHQRDTGFRWSAPLRCCAVRCLPPVSMTWIFGVTRCATEHRRARRVSPMKPHVMVSEANHLADSTVQPPCHPARCLPLVSMTWIFAAVRCATEHRRARRVSPMKPHVMVSEANHLTEFYIVFHYIAARCLPEHALSFAEGVSMTWIFAAARYAMEHHRVRPALTMKTQCHGERSEPSHRFPVVLRCTALHCSEMPPSHRLCVVLHCTASHYSEMPPSGQHDIGFRCGALLRCCAARCLLASA
jgi:hypothetical protein